MNRWNIRPAPVPRYLKASCMAIVLLCLLLQLASSAAPVGADITEPGVWGIVTVSTVSPAGDPVVADIRLVSVINGVEQPYADNAQGLLEAQVPVGSYMAYADKNGGFLTKSDVFDVAWHDHQHVVLEVSTVDIQYFAIFPEQGASGELSRVKIGYRIVNLETEMPNGEVRLAVTRSGGLFETVTIANTAPLRLGTVHGPFYYAPARSWARGQYGFSLELYVDGQLYAETDELTFSKIGGGIMSWLWIVLVIVGVLAVAAVGIVAFLLFKKRQKGEKPASAEKERYEENPARRAEEAAPKPEPAPPLEPARHLEEPVQEDEPIVQPDASLSSVSTLKARMAALGRDQGIGKADEEEPALAKTEPERPGSKKVNRPPKPLAGGKPADHKPGIVSNVTAKKEPPAEDTGEQSDQFDGGSPKSSFAEAARLRLEGHRRSGGTDKTGGEPDES